MLLFWKVDPRAKVVDLISSVEVGYFNYGILKDLCILRSIYSHFVCTIEIKIKQSVFLNCIILVSTNLAIWDNINFCPENFV